MTGKASRLGEDSLILLLALVTGVCSMSSTSVRTWLPLGFGPTVVTVVFFLVLSAATLISAISSMSKTDGQETVDGQAPLDDGDRESANGH